MAYDEKLVGRVRRALADIDALSERKMFGGICFLLRGNMLCGVDKDRLMLRVGKDADASLLTKPHCKPMDFTGRPMTGMVFVEAQGIKTIAAVGKWLKPALAFVNSLPAKPQKRKVRKP